MPDELGGMDCDSSAGLDNAFKELDADAQKVLTRLHEHILKEARSGVGTPRLSIIKVLNSMPDEEIGEMIDLYEKIKTQGLPQEEGRDEVGEPDEAVQNPAEQEEDAWWDSTWDDWEAFPWDTWSSGDNWDWQEGWDETDEWSSQYDDSWAAYRGSGASKLYIGNLPATITKDSLQKVFGAYGKVEEIHVMQGRQKRTGQSCAMVVFASQTDAESCRRYLWNGYEFKKGDGPLIVKYADDQQHKGKGKSKGISKGRGKGKGKKTSVRSHRLQ